MFALLKILRALLRFLDFAVISILALLLSFLPYKLIVPFYHRLYRLWSLLFVKMFGVQEHIHQRYRNSLPRQYILISNHPTGIDVVWLPARFKVMPLSKYEIGTWPIIGNITHAAGVIFVKRENASSRNASLIATMQALQEGKNVLIFPEGGCYGRFLNPFKNGAFIASYKTGVPILPVYVYYEEDATYEWGDIGAFKYILHLLFKPITRHAHMYIHDAVDPKQFESPEQMKDHLTQFYKQLELKHKGL
jgi:lyso-ornithine lipid O-acyltransferase